MTNASLLTRSEVELDEFDLELDVAVTGDPNTPNAPIAGFTKVTCSSYCQTTSIITCVADMGGTCCA